MDTVTKIDQNAKFCRSFLKYWLFTQLISTELIFRQDINDMARIIQAAYLYLILEKNRPIIEKNILVVF